MQASDGRGAGRRGWARAAAGLTLALGIAGAAAAESGLYLWTDAQGVVRYTPDRDHVPGGYEAVPVEPGMRIAAPPPPPPAPPTPAGGAEVATAEGTAFEADPFNAPSATRSVQGEAVERPPATAPIPPPSPAPVAAPPPPATRGPAPVAAGAPARAAGTATDTAALDARIRELEASIARDEEALKTLISVAAEPAADDPLLDSDELREIARRLPGLQADLDALRRRRAQPSGP